MLIMGACTWTTSSLVLFFNTLLLPSLLLLSLLLSPVLSLHVVQGSSCTAVCTEYYIHPNTTVDQVTCHDSDYNNTSVGQRFKDCISCELQSQTFDHGTSQTDLGWALCKSTIDIIPFPPLASVNDQLRLIGWGIAIGSSQHQVYLELLYIWCAGLG